MKWYVTTVIMPDNKTYVGINEYYNNGEERETGFIAICETEQDADELCKVYATKHNLPTFKEYREV